MMTPLTRPVIIRCPYMSEEELHQEMSIVKHRFNRVNNMYVPESKYS